MTQHITQEQAQVIADELYTQFHGKSLSGAFANSAIQHYIDQQAKKLPVLPEPVDLIQAVWRGDREWMCPSGFYYTAEQLKAYGQQCAAHAREMAISETVSIAYGYADNLTWNDSFKSEIKALKGK